MLAIKRLVERETGTRVEKSRLANSISTGKVMAVLKQKLAVAVVSLVLFLSFSHFSLCSTLSLFLSLPLSLFPFATSSTLSLPPCLPTLPCLLPQPLFPPPPLVPSLLFFPLSPLLAFFFFFLYKSTRQLLDLLVRL